MIADEYSRGFRAKRNVIYANIAPYKNGRGSIAMRTGHGIIIRVESGHVRKLVRARSISYRSVPRNPVWRLLTGTAGTWKVVSCASQTHLLRVFVLRRRRVNSTRSVIYYDLCRLSNNYRVSFNERANSNRKNRSSVTCPRALETHRAVLVLRAHPSRGVYAYEISDFDVGAVMSNENSNRIKNNRSEWVKYTKSDWISQSPSSLRYAVDRLKIQNMLKTVQTECIHYIYTQVTKTTQYAKMIFFLNSYSVTNASNCDFYFEKCPNI